MSKSNSKTNLDVFSLALWLSAAFSGLVLVIYGYLGFFSRHLADDYCSVNFTKMNFFEALWQNYMNISDRFSNFMLITLSESISPHSVAILPALMLILWIAGIAWMLYEASNFNGRPWNKLTIATLTLLLVFFSLLEAPNRFQILYWRSSMATHFAPLVCMSYLAAFILRSITAAEKKPPTVWVYPLVFFVAFIIGGFSEPTVVLMISLLALAIFSTWLWLKTPARNSALWLLFWTFVGAALALTAMGISPANSFRLGNAPPPTVMVLFSRAFLYGVEFILNSFRTLPLPTLFTVLMPFLIFYNLRSESAPALTSGQRKNMLILMAVIPVICYLLIVGSFLPSVYGQSFPVERARFTGQLCLVAGLMIEASLLASLLAQFKTSLPLKLISAVLLAVTALYPLRSAWISLGDIPEYRTRAQEWDVREGQIFEWRKKSLDLIVDQFNGVDGVKELDVSENHWVNRCAAQYYGLNTIRAYPQPNIP
jgi:hypothetical protein